MRSTITAFVFLLLPFAAAAENFDKAARDAAAAWQFPALGVAVVQDDKVVFVKAYGVKEIGKPEPVTADSLFQIGSTTKAFTATAMAMLADEKKLDWDDPVRQYIDASDHATGHRFAQGAVSVQPPLDDTNVGPAGAIKSSARDMAQWLRFHLAGGVIGGKRLFGQEFSKR